MSNFYGRFLASPLGMLRIAANDRAVVRIDFPTATTKGTSHGASANSVLDEATAQLEAYFAGRLTRFDLPLEPKGTAFQLAVWHALTGIAFGEVRSYAAIAAAIARPNAARAVGRANATNPIPIVIPCHRVIGADGSLTGYAGGLDVKRRLLERERAIAEAA